MKVVVLTTSYPRSADDVAGAFVRDAVEHLRAAGAQIKVVSPASFRHFGLAYEHGIVGNLRRSPWKVVLVPAFLASYAIAARRAARDADVVHAHWLPSALPALTTGKPFVLQLWGTDVELAARARWVARRLVRRARVVLCPSEALAAAARDLGGRDVRVVPSGVTIPDVVGEPEDPPHALFVGRLSEEKGILDFVAATEGLPRVIVGDGPLRDRVPDALGFVAPRELGPYYERAAVVVCPSHREGYGVVAREAMAHGRPVVATAVGGLVDAVGDAATGTLVQPRDRAALRAAIEALLADSEHCRSLGAAAREAARERFSWSVATQETLRAYRDRTSTSEPEVTSLAETLADYERAWNERPLLRRLYRDWFEQIAARMWAGHGISVELGSGIGRLRDAVPSIVLTDVEPTPWSSRVVRAEELPFGDGEVANLVLIDVFHHVAQPTRFLDEAARVLTPGGRIVILDPYCSPVSTPLYRRFHAERTELGVEPFADDPRVAAAPFESNQARATLAFFRSRAEFEARWPELTIAERSRLAFFAYPLSGGFMRRPLVPEWLGATLQRLEPACSWAAPVLAFRCLVVLERSGET